jgi:hypothetical protein
VVAHHNSEGRDDSFSLKFEIDISLLSVGETLLHSIDTRDAASAISRVTTLGQVAVSGRKMKMIYIKWGRESIHTEHIRILPGQIDK